MANRHARRRAALEERRFVDWMRRRCFELWGEQHLTEEAMLDRLEMAVPHELARRFRLVVERERVWR